jgi:succinate dehydrogenase subunit D
MARSNKPIVWGLFAAGGTVAAFMVPVLILLTCLAIPLGLLPADVLSYEHLIGMLRDPFSRLVAFGVLFLIVWHAAHRMRITAHDFGIRSDTLVAFICYGIAAAGTLLMLVAVFRI